MQRLTREQLEAIRKRAEAATQGPWVWENHAELRSASSEYAVLEAAQDGTGELFIDSWQRDEEFIAKSREDIPTLLAEVERLQKIIDSQDQSTQRQILEETQRIRRELDRTRIERDFHWDVGY